MFPKLAFFTRSCGYVFFSYYHHFLDINQLISKQSKEIHKEVSRGSCE